MFIVGYGIALAGRGVPADIYIPWTPQMIGEDLDIEKAGFYGGHIMASNFDFMAKYWPDIAQIGKLAELYLYADANACIYKIGMLAGL